MTTQPDVNTIHSGSATRGRLRRRRRHVCRVTGRPVDDRDELRLRRTAPPVPAAHGVGSDLTGSGLGLLREQGGANGLHAVTGSRGDFEPDPPVLDDVADDRRPAEPRQHEAADAVDVLVLELDVEAPVRARRAGPCPRRCTDPSGAGTSGGDSGTPSSISPTTSSNRSSMLTMPAVPPCSSITTARCACARCIVVSTSSSERGLRHDGNRPHVAARDRLVAREPPQQILDVQHADDVIEVALEDRIARVTMLADQPRESRRPTRRRECRRPGRAAPSPARP